MKNKIKISLIIFFLGLLTVIFFNFERAWSFPDQSWPLEKGEKVKIRSEVVQKFQAERNGLERIKILFRSSDTKPGGTFDFKLFDENRQTLIRETKVDIVSLKSSNTIDFIFKRIEESKDKVFCISLSYEQRGTGKKANIFVTENTMKQKKFLSINGEKLDGQSISMRPTYSNENIWQNISELNKRMSQYKPWFLKHYFLYTIVFLFLIISVSIVVILILI